MPTEPDYKAAYEALMDAIDQCDRILYRAQMITSVELAIQSGETVDAELLEHYKMLKASASRT